jgi:hypothetical protein
MNPKNKNKNKKSTKFRNNKKLKRKIIRNKNAFVETRSEQHLTED